MNPVVLAAIAISLVSLGTVSMASIASQQAVSNANLQKAILERDRLAEQANAYISAVKPSGSNTVATVKNTGTSPVTIDHCLVLSQTSSVGGTRPTATKVLAVSGNTVNPGSTFDIAIAGSITSDNIKCVTSKGTVLPVKLDAAASADSDVADDLAIYSVVANVIPGTKSFRNNVVYKPAGVPSPDYSTTPAGSLVWSIPVISPVTVSQVLRYDSNGNPVDISSGLTGTYAANSNIRVPIAGQTSKVAIKYTDSAGVEKTANIYPQTIARFTSSTASSTGTGGEISYVRAYNWCTSIAGYSCGGQSLKVDAVVQYSYPTYRRPTPDPNIGMMVGMNAFCRYYPCTTDGGVEYQQDQYGRYWGYGYYAKMSGAYFLQTVPQVVDVFSFPAPAPSFTVMLSLSRDASVSGKLAFGSLSIPTYTRITVTGTSSSSSAIYDSGNTILSGSVSWTRACNNPYSPPGCYYSISGSEHREGTYQFRIEGVQTGQPIQVRVAHTADVRVNGMSSGYINGYGWLDDKVFPQISGRTTTLTISQ